MNPITVIAHQLRSGDVVLAIVLILFVSWGVARVLLKMPRWSRDWERRYSQFAWQLGCFLGLEQAYEFISGSIPHETDVALLNAYRLLDFEWQHGFFVESRIERFFLHFPLIMNFVDVSYVVGHLVGTIGVLIWVYTRRREEYPFIRNMLMVATAIALVVFYFYPTAPPRMLTNYGFVDPLQAHHLVAAGGAQASSYTYNPYASMPSLHVGYALIVSWTVSRAARRRLVQFIAAGYPFFMAAVVVITGNHWLLDILGACVTVGLARLIILGFAHLRDTFHPHPVQPVLQRGLEAGSVSRT